MRATFIFQLGIPFLFCFAGFAHAASLEEMIKNTQTAVPASPPITNSASIPDPRTVTSGNPKPEAAVSPNEAASGALKKNMFSAQGSCGFIGITIGCPEGGIKPSPDLPELNKMLRSLSSLSSTTANTAEGKAALAMLGNQLGRIDAATLTQQIETLAKAEPAVQLGALRRLSIPYTNPYVAKDPVKAMETLILDATSQSNRGGKVENGIKESVRILQQLQQQVKDPFAKAALADRIGNLQALADKKLASKAAQQLLSPFLDEAGGLMVNPRSKRKLTTQDLAIAMTMMTLEEGVIPQEDPPPAAMTRREQATSLDDN